jgi:hypothetical protein
LNWNCPIAPSAQLLPYRFPISPIAYRSRKYPEILGAARFKNTPFCPLFSFLHPMKPQRGILDTPQPENPPQKRNLSASMFKIPSSGSILVSTQYSSNSPISGSKFHHSQHL